MDYEQECKPTRCEWVCMLIVAVSIVVISVWTIWHYEVKHREANQPVKVEVKDDKR